MGYKITSIETRALEATQLSAFPVNFMEIRRSVTLLLGEIGRYGFFDEYTTHNFSHVEEMLQIAEWVIPEKTKEALTPADCFLLTMSIYFHDLGLLITRDEYETRNKANILVWAENYLFNGADGQDYRSRVAEIEGGQRDRLLYQEYVRFHHGSRVKSWLEGAVKGEEANSVDVVAEIQKLIDPLPITAKRGIAKLCESHNLDDIDDIAKYPLSQPYGNSRDEEANLQYLAVILRTVDLLQISKSRAPSTLFRVISPSNPVSQVEWHKQNAVTRVRKKATVDQEGRTDASLQSDTIEVFAHFFEAEGFFGLTSYLRYAESQLERSFQAIEKSRKQHGGLHLFPWRKIDDKNVEAEGFIPRTFGFELDQSRILTLLTGHTLYNDSTVVIRELAQNSIDAVRLRWGERDVKTNGRIVISWDSAKSELLVIDNGTGMTQDVIERHLLKVGSSRYQDPQFRKEHPNFNPISRFGIGVLTAFMVADSVEIVTASPEEAEARQISLRTVHGKYLIRLLEKTDAAVSHLGGHGTSFRLRLRPSAKTVDVLSTVQRWIIFPDCTVEVIIDKEEAVKIGFTKPAEALEAYLSSDRGKRLVSNRDYKVIEKEIPGLNLAYAVSKDEFFKDWALVGAGDTRHRREIEETPVGTCVEGVAVDFDTPGFTGQTILAIANATGRSAPRTNVARSALEDTPERAATIAKIYKLFAEQIADEVERLTATGNYSLSWAVGQAPFIAAPYTSPRAPQADRTAFADSIAQLPLFLVESGGTREAASLDNLVMRGEFWLVEAPLIHSVEDLVREAPSNVTARSIIELTQGKGWLPEGDIVSNATTSLLALETLHRKFELKEIRAKEAERRIDAKLGLIGDQALWLSGDNILTRIRKFDVRLASLFSELSQRSRSRQAMSTLWVPLDEVMTTGLEDYGSVDVLRATYVLPGQEIVKNIVDLYKNGTLESLMQAAIHFEAINILRSKAIRSYETNVAMLQRFLQEFSEIIDEAHIDTDALLNAVRVSQFRNFDPLAWQRREEDEFDIEF